jgi:branched-subunit amino acid transport protein
VAAGPSAATFVLGASFGAAAAAAGWGFAAPLVFSAFAFSGSAQFSLLTTLPAGSALAAVTTAILINTRYLAMALALGDRALPSVARRVVSLMAPVLLSGLIVVELAGKDWGGLDWPQLAGVALAGLAWAVRAPMLAAVLVGALVTAVIRML